MISQPSKTLTEHAAEKLERKFPTSHTDTTRVVWWDNGGYLREIVRSAAAELGIGFRAAEGFPLQLRIDAVAEERDMSEPLVWYIGEAKDERDWFRDIRETGNEISCSIEELTAELYEVNPWDIFDVERHDPEARHQAAEIITDRFAQHGIPQYDDLKEAIITRGGGQLLDHLLRDGWPEISTDAKTVADVRDRLQENHDISIPAGAPPDTITETVRRWAVAQALIDSGVAPEQFDTDVGNAGYSPLTDLLQLRGVRTSADRYLGEEFWPDVITSLDDVWAHAACPVEGALDVALWNAWYDGYTDGELDDCIERATLRQEALSVYPETTAWVELWTQAEHLARLQQYFSDWESRVQAGDPFEAYADSDEGSWRIDNEVLQLQLIGTPDDELPPTHPAGEALPQLREKLLRSRYQEYLTSLAEEVEATMQVNPALMNTPPAHEWWADHEDEFDDLGTVAIFLIDALRFDLAQRLADQLDEEFEVKQETRIATLPSETKFGMAALTPGRSFRFEVTMDDDTLTVLQGERSLSNKSKRVRFYEDEGWEVPDNPEDGWEHSRIAYYDKEIDDVGEGEIGDIERHFSEYIEELSEEIQHKLADENWDRIYVVTDHGFVLLPEDTTMESVPDETPGAEIKYRRVAGDEIQNTGSGVFLPSETPGLEYLDTNLRLLVDPYQHFSKQGYGDSRYYHGGLLPQECMLSFLEIQP